MKFGIFCVAVFATVSLFGADANLMIAINGAALNAHPQVTSLRNWLDSKFAASGRKSIADQIAEENLDETLLNSRVTFYCDTNTIDPFAPEIPAANAVAIIDTPDGKAPALFAAIRNRLKLKNEKQNSDSNTIPQEVYGVANGAKVTLRLNSASQIQGQLGEAFSLPLDLAKINPILTLAAKSNRLFSVAFAVPPTEANANTPALPIQDIKFVVIAVENTLPEATIALEGEFANNNAAAQAQGMMELLLMGIQQNQSIDNRFFKNINRNINDNKLTYTRKIDADFVGALRDSVSGKLEQFTIIKNVPTGPNAE
ncbi:MAG: hypothetical protein LBM70_07375 [Victivallales bacterium]|jgi:hypothetical protein|nr:hypothetical protein [Victivallales bacterium]